MKYKKGPGPEKAAKLSMEFDELFSTKTIYDALNDRIEKTRNKKEELLKVLKYPWLPLHNNDSELGARVEKDAGRMSAYTQYPMREQQQKTPSLPLPKPPKNWGSMPSTTFTTGFPEISTCRHFLI